MTLSLDLASRASLGDLKPGCISPLCAVPVHIERPEYVFHDSPERVTVSDVKDPEMIERIRYAGKIVAQVLELVGGAVKPGVTTDELDRIGHDFLTVHDAYPSCLGYMSYPKSLCILTNEVICHGIPDDRPPEEGDIINVGITAYIKGVHGDTYRMLEVGTVDGESHLLIERTKNATMRGIKAIAPGREINVIGRVIERCARRFDYGVARDYTGHGVGGASHSGFIIPHYDAAPNYSTVIKPGMVFTIEPVITLGGIDWEQWDDEWTVVTADRSRTAQLEHTIVVTEDGAETFTLL